MRIFLTYILLLFSSAIISAQQGNTFTIIGDSLIGRVENGQNVREVIGNVLMTQDNVNIKCNRAIQYLRDNEAELIGNVIVTQDTMTIKTNYAHYFGSDKKAFSNAGLILEDGLMKLEAKNGYYYFDEERAYFYQDVKLTDEASVLVSDTLDYFKEKAKAIAIGNVNVSDSVSSINADSLIHFRDDKNTYAYNNVSIHSIKDNLTIFGGKLSHIRKDKYSLIEDEPLFIQIDTTSSGKVDTLMISSRMMEDVTDSTRKFIATDSVKIVRDDFASRNNKSVYFKDEERILTVKTEGEKVPPVLWYNQTQLSGDSVNIYLDENELKLVDIRHNALLVSDITDYIYRFDQISGDHIKMFFVNDALIRTEVDRNVLSIYYLFEEDEANGLIKSSAERAKILFDDNSVSDVRLYGSPMSEYHPENVIIKNEKDYTLPTFIQYKFRPSKTVLTKGRNLNY